MNLFKIGDIALNMDRVNGIQDHPAPTDPATPAGQDTIRVLFDTASIDLTGLDAQALRRWVRHNSRNLAPVKNEDGEPLLAPEDQLTKVSDILIGHLDRARPRDAAARHLARRLASLMESYITGQLNSVSVRSFEREFDEPQAEARTD